MYVNSIGISDVQPTGFTIAVDGVFEKRSGQSAQVAAPDGILVEYLRLEPDILDQYSQAMGIREPSAPMEEEAADLNPDYETLNLRQLQVSVPNISRVEYLKKICGDCWVNPNELREAASQILPIGKIHLEPFSSIGHSSSATLNGRLFLYDLSGFEQFCDDLLVNGAGAWIMSGIVNVYGAGINFRNIRFNRAMMMSGLPFPSAKGRTANIDALKMEKPSVEQLVTPAVTTTAMWFDPVPDGTSSSELKFHTTVMMHNDGPLYITDLGNLDFKLSYDNSTIAYIHSESMPLNIGDNHITMAGHLETTSPKLQDLIDHVSRGHTMALEVEGDVSSDSENPFNAIVKRLKLATMLEGSATRAESLVLYKRVVEVQVLPYGASSDSVISDDDATWVELPRNVLRRLIAVVQERRPERQERRAARRARRRRLSASDASSQYDDLFDEDMGNDDVMASGLSPRVLARGDGKVLQVAQDVMSSGIRIFGQFMNGMMNSDMTVTERTPTASRPTSLEGFGRESVLQSNTLTSTVRSLGLEERANMLHSMVDTSSSASQGVPLAGKGLLGENLAETVNGLVNLLLEGADLRGLPSTRVGRFFNGIKQIFGRQPKQTNLTEAVALPQRGATIKFRSTPEELTRKALPHLVDALTLRGRILLGLWHPFSRLMIDDMTMVGKVYYASTDGWEMIGSMSGRVTGTIMSTYDIELYRNDSAAAPSVDDIFIWQRQRQMGVVQGKDDLLTALFEVNMNLVPSAHTIRFIQAMIMDPEISIKVRDFDYSVLCTANGAVPLKMEAADRTEYLKVKAMQGLGSVKLVDFRFAPMDELSLVLILEQQTDAPVVMDTGPLFLDWHFHGQMIGPVAINNLHFAPGRNRWEVRIGFYPLSSVMQHTAAIVQDIMSSSSLRFCVTNRRDNLSEGERLKLSMTQVPFNALIQIFLEDAEEACMNVPNPLQDVNSGLSGLLPAVGQLIMNVLREAALQPAQTSPPTSNSQ